MQLSDDFTISASAVETVQRGLDAIGGTRAKIVSHDAARLVIRFKPGWTRNPATVEVLLTAAGDAAVDIVLNGSIQGRGSTQEAYLAEAMRTVRRALEEPRRVDGATVRNRQ